MSITRDDRGNVREAASEAISILVRTSETTRASLLPTLVRHLDNPSPASIPSIIEGLRNFRLFYHHS